MACRRSFHSLRWQQYSWLLFLLRSLAVCLYPCAVNAQGMYEEPVSMQHVQDLTIHAPVSLCETAGLSGSLSGLPGITRFRIPGQSRVTERAKLFTVAKVKVAVAPDQKYYRPKIDICLHWNLSMPAGECRSDQWRSLEKGSWTAAISPFETRVLDLRSSDTSKCGVLLSVHEEFQVFHVFFLVIGASLILVAPFLGVWVPFYYTTGMTIGVLLVVLFLLFQSMKLLPTGRKSSFYVLFYGCLLGAGTILLTYITAAAQSALQALGFGEDLVGPVVIFLLATLFLVGAGLGFWIVRKFILMPDGTPDIQTAKFIEWSLRLLGIVFCFMSSADSVFALGCPVAVLAINSLLNRSRWRPVVAYVASKIWKRRTLPKEVPLPEEEVPGTPVRESLNRSRALFMEGSQLELGSLSPGDHPFHSGSAESLNVVLKPHYSAIHNESVRERLSPEEAAEISRRCTEKAVEDLCSSPSFATWALEAYKERRLQVHLSEGEVAREERTNLEIEETAEDSY